MSHQTNNSINYALAWFGLTSLILFFLLLDASTNIPTDPVTVPTSFAIATFATVEHLSAIFALKQSLDTHDTRYSDFVLLHDDSIQEQQLTFLGENQISCRLVVPKIEVPSTLSETKGNIQKTLCEAISMEKLAMFRQLRDFRRILYLDFDMLPLTNLTNLALLTPISSAFPIAAPGKPGLEPELQAGILIFDPGLIKFSEVLARLHDEHDGCGFQADGSTVSENFFRRDASFSNTSNVLVRASLKNENGNTEDWQIFHFDREKPWDRDYPRRDVNVEYVELWQVRLRDSKWSEFQSLFHTALVYLITDGLYLKQLGKTFKTVRQNWLDIFRLPVIFFHTENVQRDMIETELQGALTGLDTRFALINREVPHFLPEMKEAVCICCCNNNLKRLPNGTRGGKYNLDYCFMTRFRTLRFYTHQAMSDFRYFVQLDTDISIEKPMPYDPLVNMTKQQAIFGYAELTVRPDSTTDCNIGLYESISSWFAENKIDPVFLPERGASYAGNFNIGDLDFFRSKQYAAFSEWINNKKYGIWTHRWVDQAFLPNILGAYFDSSYHLHFSDLFDHKIAVHKSMSLGKKLNPSTAHIWNASGIVNV